FRIPGKAVGRSRRRSTKRCRRQFSRRRCTSGSVPAVKRTMPTSCSPQCDSSLAVTWKRPPESRPHNMENRHSDALVFFGATGDLAYKKIFPALQAMLKRGNLDIPIIGVAKAGWNLDQLRARARESVERHGGLDAEAFERLSRLLRYVDG